MKLLLFLLSGIFVQTAAQNSGNTLASSEEKIVRSWGINEGLPVNTTNFIMQDHEGFIWFTTYDGVVRFDGIRFQVFNHANTPEMPQNRAVDIMQQDDGTTWFSLENGGVVRITKEGNFSHFDERNGFTRANVRSIQQGKNSDMWFTTVDGLFAYRNGEFERMLDRDTAAKNDVYHLLEDLDGSLWISTFDGLVHIDEDSTKYYYAQTEPASNQIKFTYRTEDQDLLVASQSGLFTFDPENNRIIIPDYFQELMNQSIRSIHEYRSGLLISTNEALYRFEDGSLTIITSFENHRDGFMHFYEDSQANLWMITLSGELAQLNGNSVTVLNGKSNIPDYHFNRIIEDQEGSLWLSTARDGIVQVRNSKVKHIGEPEGLSGDNILGIFKDSQNRIWAGTRDLGLNIIEDNEISILRQNGELTSDIVYSVDELENGNILIGTYQGGLQIFDGENFQTYTFGDGVRNNTIRAIQISDDSTVWLGTDHGLVQFDPRSGDFTQFTTEDGLSGNLIRYIDEDTTGALWIGTQDGGVSRFHNGEFINYTTERGLSSDNIRSVYVDEFDDETIWIGTETNGLNRIRNEQVRSVSAEDGLPDHIIHFVSQDKKGWLWMSSNRGIFKVDKNQLNNYLDGQSDRFNIIHYGSEDGMRNAEANGAFKQGGLRVQNKEFWFSTQQGISIFDINPEITNTKPPSVHIKNIVASGIEVKKEDQYHLESGVRNFTIEFHALTFNNPEKTRYRYRLSGVDSKWKEGQGAREIEYRNLSKGSYEFEIIAANDDGVWSSEPATATIVIQPLFYESIWFYISIFTFIIVVSFGISKYRLRSLEQRQQKLQEEIDAQTKELKQNNRLKDKLFSIIAHDLRGPFQALLGLTELMKEDLKTLDEVEKQKMVGHIHYSSKSLYELTENLLEWASLQTGRLKPLAEEFNLSELTQKIVGVQEQVAKQKNIQLSSEIPKGIEICADSNMVDTIFRNLISNAIKFTPEQGKVSISLTESADQVILSVADTGMGMSQEMVNKLLIVGNSRSRRGTNQEKGTGLGLIICKEMIEKHHGELSISSKPDKGSTFTVTLPKEGVEN